MNSEQCYKSNWSIGVKKSREKDKELFENCYTLDETKKFLNKINIEKYLGSGKQRTLIKDDFKLYSSIIKNTEVLNKTKNVNLRARIQFILLNEDIYCECKKQSIYDNVNFKFTKFCKECSPKFNSIEYFKNKDSENFQKLYDENKIKMSENLKGVMNLNWFKEKYGEKEGLIKYNERYNKLLDKLNLPYSKISQKLFWKLYDILEDKEEIFFAELNREKHLNLNKQDKSLLNNESKVRINLDFVYKNKVIEFNGEYWHSSEETRLNDLKRKEICKNKGYDVLFIWENEFKQFPEEVINRCLRFLNDDCKINDRFMIKTTNGYETFDDIIFKGKMETLVFKTTNELIEVSRKHKFVISNIEYIAEELKVGDYLETVNGLEPIIKIEEIKKEKEVFDILNTNSHTFIANNINNHNCSFLGSSHTLISSEKLAKMEQLEPILVRDGKLRIYEEPIKGHKYIMSVDPAKDGKDAFAIQVVDITDFCFKQVATAQLQIDYLLMPEYINDWCEYYNKPYLVIENNEGAGQSIADQMYKDYEYENIHVDKDSSSGKRKKYSGFRTTPKSRKLILQTLKLFIENDRLNVVDKSTINEFLQFILVNNKYQADEGAHDDMIMSLALIFVPFCNSKNFEDMKSLVKNLYSVEPDENNKSSFSDHLSIGYFDDGIEDSETKTRAYSWNGFMVEESYES